ncbi:MAG: hypothetical protein HWE08_14420 [Alphaproteobacteria bacterium]|nr:hypothetical protein [Alphaproteobacteria bacterium]
MAKYLTLLVWLLISAPSAFAETFKIAIASDDDLYVAEILKLAVNAAGGDHSVEVVRIAPIAQGRALRALADGRAAYNVLYSGYSMQREQELTMVDFPLTRGLLGYRVLAVRPNAKRPLSSEALFDPQGKPVCFGSGNDWPDTAIMRLAGLCVVTAADENLWPMLMRGRFEAFPRSVIEAKSEIAMISGGEEGPPPVIDQNLLLAYKQDLFFFMPLRAKEQAKLIEDGLKKLHAEGRYDPFFYSIPIVKEALEELITHPRTVVRLETPKEFVALNQIPERYWYDFDDASSFVENMPN